ncbi:MAG: DUF6430 domain-containing protein [Candidatus Poribacteria bacterium]|nr:DUF6430 domain-containing protein [Candidatus Poribacteria bacterium]
MITTACSVYGIVWWGIKVLSYFHSGFEEWSRGNFSMLVFIFFLGLGVGTVQFLWKCAKMLSVSHRLEGQDILIEIRVGDIFSADGAFIISTNTAFDMDMSDGPISPETLQGQFTKKYYDDVAHLNQALAEALESEKSIVDEDNSAEKESPDIGTVVKVSPRQRLAYFVAIDTLNEHTGVESSLDNVRKGLGSLWQYIGTQGVLDPLVIPVLGTGYSGIPVSREQMIIEIITSFIAACTEKKFCEKLTIIISEDDYRQQDINLEELGTYLRLYAREVHRKAHNLIDPVDKLI